MHILPIETNLCCFVIQGFHTTFRTVQHPYHSKSFLVSVVIMKKPRGKPFEKGGDPRQSQGAPSKDEQTQDRRVREPKTAFANCAGPARVIPPGASLRPYDDSNSRETNKSEQPLENSENWIVDDQKLMTALNDAVSCHRTKHRMNHTPKLIKHRVVKVGFGVQVSFKCGFKACKFESPLYDLYMTAPNGQPLTNLQVGVAMSKTDLTPRTIETLSATLNLHSPNTKTLQKSYQRAMDVAEGLAEEAMSANREEVTTTLRLRGEVEPGTIPQADVAIDGQYSNRSYHFPTGKSDSVSVPVVEQVTGKGLLVQHTNLSHRDGTLPKDVHINSGETLAARLNYEKTHSTPHFPLHFGVVTTDGDTGLIKALEAGRSGVGEERPLVRRNCSYHGEAAAKRKFNRESLTKLTQAQRDQMNKNPSPLETDVSPNQCAACLKQCASSKGLTIHRRSCKGERAVECSIRGLEPLFAEMEKTQGKLTVRDKKLWRDGIRRWVLKRMKQEMNLVLHSFNPQNISLKNDSEIHASIHLAGKTIIPCLSGDHSQCLRDSKVCQGPDAALDYDFLPSKAALGPIPSQTKVWLQSIVDTMLSKEALVSLVVHGKKATTTLVESVHKEIRLPVPKGRVYRKNEHKLIKSGTKAVMNHFDNM